MTEPEFRARVNDERAATVRAVRSRLASASVGAVETLDELRRNGRSETVRLAAARTLIQYALAPARPSLLAEIDAADVARIGRDLVEMALRYIPEDRAPLFAREVQSYAESGAL